MEDFQTPETLLGLLIATNFMVLAGMAFMTRFSQTKLWLSAYQFLTYTYIVLLTTGGLFIFTNLYAGEPAGPILVLMFSICGGLTLYAWFIRRRVKNPEAAVKFYSTRIQILPYDLGNYNVRALAYQQLKDYDAAIADYARMNDLIGDKTDKVSNMYRETVINNLGAIYFSQGQYEQALIQFTKALAQPGTSDWAKCVMHVSRGNTYIELYNMEAAIEEFDRVHTLLPKLVQAHQRDMTFRVLVGHTMAQYRLERVDRAIEYWQKAVKVDKKILDSPWLENESQWLEWQIEAAKDLNTRLDQ